MKKKLTLLVLAVALLATGCGLSSSDPDEIGLVYSGGIVEDKTFQKILKPGSTNNSTGYGSKTYKYPITQRTFIFDAGWEGQRQLEPDERSVDAPALQIVSKDNIRLAAPAQLYFTLRWGNEKILRQFHEKLGFKTDAYTDDGWVAMLDQYVAPTAQRAAESAGLKHNWRDLYTSEEVRKEFARDTITAFKAGLEDVVGGNYFCGPKYDGETDDCDDFTLQIGKPTPPEKILTAIEDTERAREAALAQIQENERIRQQVLGEQELVRLYGPYAAMVLKAIESGKVQTFIIDNEGRSSVQARP